VTDGYLRVGPIQGLPSLLRALGQDPDTVIRGAGVDPELLADPENFIGFTALGRLLAACAASTACPHFGLLLGQRTGLEALGLVGLLAEHSPNVGSALHNLVLHLHLHDRGAVPTLVIEGECALFGYAIYQPGVEGTRQIYDGALAIVFNILKALCGPLWQPTEVLFSHSKPANSEPFRRFFQARLRFDAERSALVFSAACLRQPLGGSNPLLRKLLEERIALLESLGAGDIVSQVRRVLHHRLLSGQGSLGQVAEIFAIHRRTLNRRLRGHGLTFQHLLDEVRYAIACQLLRETDMAIVEIGTALGYADPAAFTRAFRRWSGTTPSAWRGTRRRP
jgi:AraC-like DNA-binding protein